MDKNQSKLARRSQRRKHFGEGGEQLLAEVAKALEVGVDDLIK